jgi:hypothetical protein
MRVFWTGFLMTGLLLIGISTYERRAERTRGESPASGVAQSEDGTGFPYPHPTPKTK